MHMLLVIIGGTVLLGVFALLLLVVFAVPAGLAAVLAWQLAKG